MAWEGKKYMLEKSESFDEYMREIGMGFVYRRVANTLHPVCSLQKNGDEYSFHTVSIFKTTVINFKPGEEFEYETIDGRKVMSVITIEGNTMTQIEKGEKETKIIREFSDTELVTTLKVNDIVAKRWYKVAD
ncbi:hypothetical protein ACKWTF_006908 [Chironomus riparius]